MKYGYGIWPIKIGEEGVYPLLKFQLSIRLLKLDENAGVTGHVNQPLENLGHLRGLGSLPLRMQFIL
jgi:hypothetical protein